jgi:transcriptional adapter 3
MSGKGKQNSKKAVVKSVKESGKLTQSVLANSDTSSEGSEMTVLPVIKMIDNSKVLPRYYSVLQRNAEDGINMEDLDILQLELEMLLSSVVVRSRMLQEEIASLSASEERRDRRSKSGKGLALIDKKLREDKLKPKEIGLKAQSPLPAKLLKQRAMGSSANQVVPNPHEIVRVEGSKSDSHTKLLLPKNDTLNKFWASVDPYCADIMPDDIKLLEELISNHGDIGEFKKIPVLGRHYSLMWAHNDLMQEEDAGNPNREKKKNRTDLSLLMSKADKKSNGTFLFILY